MDTVLKAQKCQNTLPLLGLCSSADFSSQQHAGKSTYDITFATLQGLTKLTLLVESHRNTRPLTAMHL